MWATRSERASPAQLITASAGELSLSSSAGLSPVDAAELFFSGAHVMYGPTGQERRHMSGGIFPISGAESRVSLRFEPSQRLTTSALCI